MASVSRIARNGARFFSAGAATRGAATGRGSVRTLRRAGVAVGALMSGTAVAYGGAHAFKRESSPSSLFPTLHAGSPVCQPSVVAEGKTHSLYLWIHMKPTANPKECAKAVASLQDKVLKVTGPDVDDDDCILAGVGFGTNFYKRITKGKGAPENYTYSDRKGYLGEMPSTGGDIFIHAKSNCYSNLFELAQQVMKALPSNSVAKAEDIYGWQYREGRDLSGFIDGTENPADDDDRERVAVNSQCGGSYCMTQRWLHNHDIISNTKERTLENWVGRTRPDSIEQTRKSPSAHVARMVGGTNNPNTKPFEMVRHSQPYGTVTGESGLFFISYASSTANLEYMLDRMVGCDADGLCDDIMQFSECVSGNYWYFPSTEDLKKLQ